MDKKKYIFFINYVLSLHFFQNNYIVFKFIKFNFCLKKKKEQSALYEIKKFKFFVV